MLTANALVLIGFKASGKTTVGELLARDLGYDFLDTDALLCRQHQVENIGELYRNCGEIQFRKLEQALLHQMNWKSSLVIASGGGLVVNDENCNFLKKVATMIYLETSLESIKKRLESFKDIALFQYQDMASIYNKRLALYEKNANLIIKTDDKTPQQLVVEIKQNLGL